MEIKRETWLKSYEKSMEDSGCERLGGKDFDTAYGR